MWIATLIASAGVARAQIDPCGGRGTKPDGSCREMAPRPDPPSTPTGVEITSDPSGAEVRDDQGIVLGVTPLQLGTTSLKPGRHNVSIRLYGHEDAHRTVTVIQGQIQRMRAVLIAMPE